MSHPGRPGLRIEVPPAEADRPVWARVGVIAAVGFIVGIAWPKIAGVRLGPSAPGESASSPVAAVTAPLNSAPVEAPAASAPPVASVAVAPSGAGHPAATTGDTAMPTVSFARGSILSCRTADGETKKGKDCGAGPAIDAIVGARLKRLASCPAAKGATGKLSAVIAFDFAADNVVVNVGKSSTVDNPDTIAQCLSSSLKSASLGQAAHEHSRYVIAYTATFTNDGTGKPGATPAAANDPAPTASAGEEAQVSWEVGLVRDAPKTGAIVARLPRGSKVKLGGGKDGWYEISYGAAFDQKGWLYRGALGK